MPIKLRLRFLQATPVVPEPMTLSRTVSPSLVYVLIRYSNKATGFCVGCKPDSLLNLMILNGYLLPSLLVTTDFLFKPVCFASPTYPCFCSYGFPSHI